MPVLISKKQCATTHKVRGLIGTCFQDAPKLKTPKEYPLTKVSGLISDMINIGNVKLRQ